MICIYVADNSNRAEMESMEKGCRLDVLVEINGQFYKPYISTIDRLLQEAQESFSNDEIFEVDPCQIIVEKTDLEHVIKAVLAYYNDNYFESFVPIDLKNVYRNTFPILGDISNWFCIYRLN